MIKEIITIQNKLGLHTRAAAKLVSTATQFASRIELKYQNQTADCKSIMSLILLGMTKDMQGELTLSGDDETQAKDAIVTLINNRFNEKE